MPVAHRVYFPAMRAFWLLKGVLRVLTRGRLTRLPWPFDALERTLSRCESRTGDQLVMLFRRSVLEGIDNNNRTRDARPPAPLSHHQESPSDFSS